MNLKPLAKLYDKQESCFLPCFSELIFKDLFLTAYNDNKN